MNKSKLKEEKGITLIALIITIIVMLILVAVTVSTVVNSGLFGKASEAGKEWKEAEGKEANALTGNITINEKEYDSIEDYVEANKATSTGEVKITDAGGNSQILTKSNAGQYYGYKVATSTYDVTGVTWRLFYIDFDNEYGDGAGTVYLKADGIIRREDLVPENYNSTNVTKFNKGYSPTTATNNNNKAVSWLLNPNNWTTYKVDAKANYAVGGPSLEMYVKSYNQFIASHTGILTAGSAEAKPLLYNYDGTGYYVGVSSTSTGGYSSGCTTKNTGDNALIKVSTNSSATEQVQAQIGMYSPGGNGYCWISTPSAYRDGCVMEFYNEYCRVGYGDYNYPSYSGTFFIWPLISLKSNVKITLVGEGS